MEVSEVSMETINVQGQFEIKGGGVRALEER